MVAFCRRSWISRSTNSSWVLPRSSPAETRTSPWAPCCANLHPPSARWLLCRGMQSFVRDSRGKNWRSGTPLAANNSVCGKKEPGEKPCEMLKKIVASMHTAQLLSIRSIRSSSENATFYSMYANRVSFSSSFPAHWQRSMFFQTAWPSF